jgi:hypothetical protein
MMVIPAEMPVTTPVVAETDPTVAIAVEPLLHTPPVDDSVRMVFRPLHTVVVPINGAGSGLTVMVENLAQVVGKVYIMFGVPAATPVTTPVEGSTVARPVLLDVHIPPDIALVKLIVKPGQTDEGPVTAAVGSTVTDCDT